MNAQQPNCTLVWHPHGSLALACALSGPWSVECTRPCHCGTAQHTPRLQLCTHGPLLALVPPQQAPGHKGCEAASDACIQQHRWWHLSHERLLAHMHLKPHKVLACIPCCLSSRELCMQCGCLCRSGCRTGCCWCRGCLSITLKPQLCSRRRCSSMCLPSVHLHRVLALCTSVSCWYLQWWCWQTKTYRWKACSSGSLTIIVTTQ